MNIEKTEPRLIEPELTKELRSIVEPLVDLSIVKSIDKFEISSHESDYDWRLTILFTDKKSKSYYIGIRIEHGFKDKFRTPEVLRMVANEIVARIRIASMNNPPNVPS